MAKKRRTSVRYHRGKNKKLKEHIEFIESCPDSPSDTEFMHSMIKECDPEMEGSERTRKWLNKMKREGRR